MAPVPRLIRELFVFDFEEYPVRIGERAAPPHVHHFWQMDLYLAGRTVLITDRKRLAFEEPGALVAIPPLKWHTSEVDPGHRRVTFKLAVAPHYLAATGREVRLAHLPAPLLALVTSMADRPTGGDGWSRIEGLAVAELCLVQVLRTVPERAEVTSDAAFETQIERLLEEIAASPRGPWTVADLARRCRLSPDHFTRRFTALLAQSPQRLLLEMRMQAAATDLLAQEAVPIKRVAEASGYASVHAFTKAFSRVFGVPPATFRRLQGRA